MAKYGPSQEIDAPQISPPVYGLLQAAPVIDRTDDHWINGIRYGSDPCGNARVLDPSCATALNTVTRKTPRPTRNEYLPFWVDVDDYCSPFAWQTAEYEARARRLMVARESKAVEREFWTGSLIPANPHLADASNYVGGVLDGQAKLTKPLGTTAVSRSVAVAGAVQAIADYNLGRGMIHLRPYLFELMAERHFIKENGKWYTHTGALVVPGAGYVGSGPTTPTTAPTTTEEWIYVTDVPQILRGSIDVPAREMSEVLDRTTNEVNLFAQRPFAIALNTCTIAGIPVNSTVA